MPTYIHTYRGVQIPGIGWASDLVLYGSTQYLWVPSTVRAICHHSGAYEVIPRPSGNLCNPALKKYTEFFAMCASELSR